ncbi:hypothetical protein B1756_15460 [Natrarchaeobaculum aegyptiacum]|uniref:Pyridoxamine 5'-phosphate oxidase n=1 Tax=Natrarchaeobaculum aegyptiacum TaxID=745377 RepID=A0A2Z2HWX5_9EURY|nr:hypothetical protein B1756_15460 [Natrarchaeobaculum aegyptiacum]
MADEEIETLLYERGVGVLSLARSGHAYGIPVSYGYDATGDRFLLDLGFAPESKKRSYLETTEQASLTIFEWHSPTDWQSIVATGDVDPIEEFDRTLEELYHASARDVDVAVFGHLPEDLEHQWYELSVQTLTGRSSASH